MLSVYIDDLNRYSFNTDYVINEISMRQGLIIKEANLLLGTRYLLMRRIFASCQTGSNTPGTKCISNFGAADMENVTPGSYKC